MKSLSRAALQVAAEDYDLEARILADVARDAHHESGEDGGARRERNACSDRQCSTIRSRVQRFSGLNQRVTRGGVNGG